MPGQDFLPRALSPLHQWVDVFSRQLLKVGAGIPEEAKAAVNEKIFAFMQRHAETIDPATARSVDIHARNIARKEMEAALRKFINAYIRYNPLLTDAERENMGMIVPTGKRHPASVPVTYPVLTHEVLARGQLSIHYRDSEKNGKGKPKGVHGVELKWVIADKQPTDYDGFIHSIFDTRTPIVLKFDLSQQGARIYMVARWENTRGEKGPWSPILSPVIS